MSGSREAKLLTELAETQDQRSSLLATNYDLRKERDRLTDELAEARNRQSCENGQPWVCHALATARSELAQYENVIIPSWKREEEGWRQDEKDAVEFRRVLAEQCDRLERELAEARAWLQKIADFDPDGTVLCEWARQALAADQPND